MGVPRLTGSSKIKKEFNVKPAKGVGETVLLVGYVIIITKLCWNTSWLLGKCSSFRSIHYISLFQQQKESIESLLTLHIIS